MGNCLKTQLKDIISNDSLTKLGHIKFVNLEAHLNDGITSYFTFTSSRFPTITALTGVVNTAAIGIQNSEKVELTDGQGNNSPCTIDIADKYSIVAMREFMNVDIKDLSSLPALKDIKITPKVGSLIKHLNIATIERMQILTNKFLFSNPIDSDWSFLRNLSSLTTFAIGNTDITVCPRDYVFDIALFGKYLPNSITTFVNNIYGCKGTIESFIANAKVNRANGQITFNLSTSNEIRFKTQLQNNTQGTLSWSNNTVNNSYTDISYNDAETTISVDAQGNWSYVNQDMSKYTG